MERIYFVVLTFFICALTSCGSNNEPGKSKHEGLASDNTHGRLILILFDYSSSMDSNGIRRIARITRDVVEKAPNRSTIRIFAIDNDISSEPIFDWIKRSPSLPSELPVYEKQLQEKPLTAAGKVLEMYQKGSKTVESCIVNGLKTIYNSLQDSSFSKEKVSLLLLTDMMECCRYGCSHKANDLKNLLQKIDEYRLNRFPLANFVQLEKIRVLPIAGRDDSQFKGIRDSDDFDNFWSQVFSNMGYSGVPIDKQVESDVIDFITRK